VERQTTNGNPVLSPEERAILHDLVEWERRVRAGLQVPDALMDRIRWNRHVAVTRERRAEEARRQERRLRERRLALDRRYRCVDCGVLVSLSTGNKAKAEGRPIRCKPCYSKIQGKARRRHRRRCRVCRKAISHNTYTSAVRAGRPPRCRECRYEEARIEPLVCVDCGKQVSKNHAYTVRKQGGIPRCHPCGQRARRIRERAAQQTAA
jgi:DNA-directed RNA polymerase subunit RPC12/RpoP